MLGGPGGPGVPAATGSESIIMSGRSVTSGGTGTVTPAANPDLEAAAVSECGVSSSSHRRYVDLKSSSHGRSPLLLVVLRPGCTPGQADSDSN
jgi:hypothetical protein